jgi:hypothetical protein
LKWSLLLQASRFSGRIVSKKKQQQNFKQQNTQTQFILFLYLFLKKYFKKK